MTREQLDEVLKANPNLKAVPTPDAGSFRATFPAKFEKAVKDFNKFSALESDPKTPFENKYKARKIFEDLLGQLLIGRVGYSQSGGHGDSKEVKAAFVEELGGMQAKMEMLLGENYYDTEETSRGYDYLCRSVEWYCPTSAKPDKLFSSSHTFPDTDLFRMRRHAADVIHNLNLLGAIKHGRGDSDEAVAVLRKTDDFFQEFVEWAEGVPSAVETEAKSIATAASARPSKATIRAATEKNVYTCFFLAAVFQSRNEPSRSALYCKRTLDKQYLEQISYIPEEYITNINGIVDYFLGAGGSLLSAAHAWLWIAKEIIRRIKKTRSTDGPVSAEQSRLDEKREAEWHRRSALVRLNTFRIRRSELIGHPAGTYVAHF